ncbi:MAG TPA: RluA family pseudouridine synthase [Fimbriimonadaceae bacterium]|nr:RluA family pseudouridine synthase [Fimbriimonadaceae bacterium]
MTLTVDEGDRLDRFLARSLPEYSRTKLADWISAGGVRVEGVVRKASFPVLSGMVVEIDAPPATPIHDLEPVAIPLDIRYEDEHLLVVNKPRGMPSHPSPNISRSTLVNALLARSHTLSREGGEFRPGIVHRLDKDTTGLLMVAKTDVIHRALADQLRDKQAERRYLAWLFGHLAQERFVVDAPIARNLQNRLQMKVYKNGKPSVTHFKRLLEGSDATLVAIRLETGRTHQIRVHASWIRHPVQGDDIYATGTWRHGALQLHAGYLGFDHPATGERLIITAEPPYDFREHALVPPRALEEF